MSEKFPPCETDGELVEGGLHIYEKAHQDFDSMKDFCGALICCLTVAWYNGNDANFDGLMKAMKVAWEGYHASHESETVH